MKFNIEHLAELARLELTEEEKESLKQHIERMLQYVELLNELNVSNVEPLVYPHEGKYQRLREDVPQEGLNRNDALKIAPEEKFFLYRVPSPLRDIK